MDELIHRAILVTGATVTMYDLHSVVRQKIWDLDADYVRLLSPLAPALAGSISSFFIAPDGWQQSSFQSTQSRLLKENILSLVSAYLCSYVEVEYRADKGPAKILSYSG
jgi:hypothetical protein